MTYVVGGGLGTIGRSGGVKDGSGEKRRVADSLQRSTEVELGEGVFVGP